MLRLATRVLLLVSSAVLFAQTPTGTITGHVTSSDQPLGCVTITAAGAASTAPRTTTSAETGDFILASLPPGSYTLTFEHDGLRRETRSVDLHIADTARLDVPMIATTAEEITVTPRSSFAGTPQVSSTFDANLVEILPIGRSILDVVRIAPGVQETGSLNLLVINGAQSYDNLYLVNGVTISQEINGQPHNLFIEDAIQETTILGAGISAEYSRFTGGVVSVLTKSGGNELSGSLRDTLTSDRWTSRTPFPAEAEHLHKIDNNYEATLGGHVIRDRLWFFAAGRYATRSDARQTFGTNIPYTHRLDDNRYEAKLTANLTPKHSIVGSYISSRSKRVNDSIGTVADLRAVFSGEIPNTLAALHYTGIAGDNLVAEAQYSRKYYNSESIGGGSTDLIFGTVIQDPSTSARAWASSFCAVCGTSYRTNHDLLAKVTWFSATTRFGSHSVVAGADDFDESMLENEHQTASDYGLETPLIYSGQNAIAQVIPGVTQIVWQPIVGVAAPTKFRSLAGFVNDRIDLGTHWSFNAGLRYDTNHGHDANGTTALDDSRLSPRAGAIYDVFGDGRHRFNASYSVYAAKIAEGITGEFAVAGTPAYFSYDYEGPEINTSGALLPNDEVLRRVFAWFAGVDRDDYLIGSFYPGGEELAGPLKTPYAREVATGYALTMRNGTVRADYIHRRWGSFYARRTTPDFEKVTTPDGVTTDRTIVENSDSDLQRRYSGVLLQGTYRFLRRLSLGGNYTWSRLTGNVENENVTGIAASIAEPAAFFPQYMHFAQNAPAGYLSGDIRHHANVWLAWTERTRVGQFDVSLLERYHSARNYNATAFVEMRRIITKNPGYVSSPSATYYFRPRGSLRVDDVSATDLGFNWAIRVRTAQLFAEADLQNVFNEDAIENPGAINRQVLINRNDRNLAIFNPFTTVPVECPQGTATSSATCKNVTNYQFAPTFGKPTNKAAYQQPRTLRISLGVRF